MKVNKNRHIFRNIGIGIVLIWLFMVGILIREVSFDHADEEARAPLDSMSAVASDQRDWMEIYLKDKKVGYSVNRISPAGEDYLIHEEIFLRLNLLGQANSMHSVSRSLVDGQFFLKNFSFMMSSGAVTFQVSGRVKQDLMLLEVGGKGLRRQESLRLKGPPVIGSGMPHFFRGRRLRIGDFFKFPAFDPSTMAQREIVMKVAAMETIVVNRIKYPAFRLDAEVWGQPMTFWLDKEGRVLKEKGLMGLTLVRSSAANAPRDLEGAGGEDFYEIAAIDAGRALQRPDRLRYLKLKVEGLAGTGFDAALLGMGRQRFNSGILEVFQEKVPSVAGWCIPYQDPTKEMGPYLGPEWNIESDHEEIVKKAMELAGKEKNPVTVARRFMAWVYGSLEKRPVITVPSALEVLKTGVGDCNEHATLLTALLRACGIPARLCVGLVYSRGKFFYHAWVESYLGTWISMDPTLNQMPADATHLKLVQGGLDRQAEIIGLIGRLGLKVIDYK